MPKKSIDDLFPEMINFVTHNQKIVEETLTVKPLSEMPEEMADVVETLQQSLLMNGIFVKLLRKYPRLMLKLINRVI